MKLSTLENIRMPQLCEVFNEAFADYFLPMDLTPEQFANNMNGDGFDPSISAGAFADDRLVGFIFHGAGLLNGVKTAYNCGTGVIPSFRGQRIVRQLYDFILPELKAAGYKSSVLEVITKNEKAIKVYEAIGFKTTRELDCYRGKPQINASPANEEIRLIDDYNWPLLRSLWDWTPSWQNSDKAVENVKHELQAYGLYKSGELLAYIIINPSRSRIIQFAVHPKHRNRGYGAQLFSHAAGITGKELVCVNIDHGSAATRSFFNAIRFSLVIRQFEMQLEL